MKRIIIGLFLAASFPVFGKSVDESSARLVAGSYLKKQGIPAVPSQLSMLHKEMSKVNGEDVTDFYVFNHGGGFIIVSGDDRVKPVLAWSEDALFDAVKIPAHVAAWLDDYKSQINTVIRTNIVPAATITNQWEVLKNDVTYSTAAKTTGGIVRPLIKTFWGQSTYYNDLCPFDATKGELTVTGCVATAMAQIMRYWKWPQKGVGNHSYYSPYGMLDADYGSRTYVWDSMPYSLGKPNAEVARLMSDAGISVNMNYGVDGSGAMVIGGGSCTQSALPGYFQYKASIKAEYRSGYSDEDWVNLVKAEMDIKRPVIFTGYGPDGGHCWLADGYSSDTMIHFNWGWSHTYDGYYTVTKLTPGGSDFTNRQEILVNIEPDSGAIVSVRDVQAGNGCNILVYPNPASDFVNISIPGGVTNAVRIFDVAGREVRSVALTKKETMVTVPVSDLSAGIYFVEMHTSGGVERKKITVSE